MIKVVLTGMGVVSPIGVGADEYWSALVSGTSACEKSEVLIEGGNKSHLACQAVGFKPTDFMDRKAVKRTSRYIQFALAASKMALDQSQGLTDYYHKERVGTFIGTGAGGYDSLDEEYSKFFSKGVRFASPFGITNIIPNMAASNVAISNHFTGPCVAPVAACAAGLYSICEAASFIQNGLIDAALAGGSESAITPFVVSGYDALRVLSTNNDSPKYASRPFDRDRDGFVISEGSAVFVLERLDKAIERGAKILGEVAGFSLTCDASHITSPDQSGAIVARTMSMALEEASLEPSDIDYINAHGTSTQINDEVEAVAIKNVFSGCEKAVKVTAIKSMLGHSLGASGALGLAASLLSLRNNMVPPTINTENVDVDFDENLVLDEALSKSCNIVMTNAFGFGGHNASLIVRSLTAGSC